MFDLVGEWRFCGLRPASVRWTAARVSARRSGRSIRPPCRRSARSAAVRCHRIALPQPRPAGTRGTSRCPFKYSSASLGLVVCHAGAARRHFVGVHRIDQLRRHKDQQFHFVLHFVDMPERHTEVGNVADPRQCRRSPIPSDSAPSPQSPASDRPSSRPSCSTSRDLMPGTVVPAIVVLVVESSSLISG